MHKLMLLQVTQTGMNPIDKKINSFLPHYFSTQGLKKLPDIRQSPTKSFIYPVKIKCSQTFCQTSVKNQNKLPLRFLLFS